MRTRGRGAASLTTRAPPGRMRALIYQPAPSLLQVVRNFRAVLWPPQFLIFLVIFTGYWIVFWQQYTSLPGFIHTYVNPNARVELILITDAAIVVCLTFVVNYLARKIPPFHAVILGTVISSVSWVILSFWPTVIGAVVSIAVLALGEIIQQPPYYAYISRLARTWVSPFSPSVLVRSSEAGSAAR